ncbi:excalibur calcium-binding domain-containing protein [Parasphingorhabdus sp.]|uniref:excalibur calcium-binding domain-containing protein n=1 Tax=Parasphingorhabdus sp. TaxID=2709688 RepID=UPI003BAFF3E1
MAKPDQNNGCGWAIAVVLGLFALGQCSKDGSNDQYADTESTLYDQSSEISSESIEMYVTAGSVNCRSGPGTNHGKLNSFLYAEPVTVLETRSGWSKTASTDCWIASRFLSEDKPEPSPAVQPPRYSEPSRLFEAPAQSSGSCGAKWKCGQMNSCSEAYHYLNNCGLGRLDGDGDGVPCESIC